MHLPTEKRSQWPSDGGLLHFPRCVSPGTSLKWSLKDLYWIFPPLHLVSLDRPVLVERRFGLLRVVLSCQGFQSLFFFWAMRFYSWVFEFRLWVPIFRIELPSRKWGSGRNTSTWLFGPGRSWRPWLLLDWSFSEVQVRLALFFSCDFLTSSRYFNTVIWCWVVKAPSYARFAYFYAPLWACFFFILFFWCHVWWITFHQKVLSIFIKIFQFSCDLCLAQSKTTIEWKVEAISRHDLKNWLFAHFDVLCQLVCPFNRSYRTNSWIY